MQYFTKDPQATLDYSIDWSEWLDSDTIQTSTWSVPTGLTTVTSSKTATTATIWLSGGTAGKVYPVTNRVTTVGGRTDERTIRILVQDR